MSNYKEAIQHLTTKLHYLENQTCSDPEHAAYDEGYIDALEYAMVVIEEFLGDEE
jgi:lysyl-tRNA synthetase class II